MAKRLYLQKSFSIAVKHLSGGASLFSKSSQKQIGNNIYRINITVKFDNYFEVQFFFFFSVLFHCVINFANRIVYRLNNKKNYKIICYLYG